MIVQARLKPVVMAANATYDIPYSQDTIGGFVCKTAGTITIIDNTGTTIVDAFQVEANQLYSFSFFLSVGNAGKVVLASGASGTVGF